MIDRPARTLGIEPFFMQLVSGIQAELSEHQVTLLFTVTEDTDAEIELYRRWWQQRRVDGVFVVDLQVDDRRVARARGAADARRGDRHAARDRGRSRPSGRMTGPAWRPWSGTWRARATAG